METYENKFLMVFTSYNQAILLYNAFKEKGCNVSLISTPCGLSRGCSQSIIFGAEDVKAIVDIVKNSGIQVASIYKIKKEDGKLNYVAI